ncbi:hypothetical protein LJB42_000440 [Komagataella kurtzmanii]|nr:hypothetical protein LJB42_000440 [Komagataella kurtzmanii]
MSTSAFIKQLATHDKPTRDDALEKLGSFLKHSKVLPELQYQKLWKGLFYAMWHCDKPIPQQHLAQQLGELYYNIPETKFIPFFRAFWVVITREWKDLDKWRVDKFLMLIRKILNKSLAKLKSEDYDRDLLEKYIQVLSEYPLHINDIIVPRTITYHLCDIYIDELEKVMFSGLPGFEEEEDYEEEDEVSVPIEKKTRDTDNSDDEASDTDPETSDEEDEGENTENESEEEPIKLSAEEETALWKTKMEIIHETPIDKLLSPFVSLKKDTSNKPLKLKIQEAVLADPRLGKWKVKSYRKLKPKPKPLQVLQKQLYEQIKYKKGKAVTGEDDDELKDEDEDDDDEVISESEADNSDEEEDEEWNGFGTI